MCARFSAIVSLATYPAAGVSAKLSFTGHTTAASFSSCRQALGCAGNVRTKGFERSRLALCSDVVADSLDGSHALAALRSAAEAGVDLTYPCGAWLAEDRGGDLLVAEPIARAHDHPMSTPVFDPPASGSWMDFGWSSRAALFRRTQVRLSDSRLTVKRTGVNSLIRA